MNILSRNTEYTESNVRKWLSWLAFQMQLHGHSIFQIEQLQPTWLYNLNHIKAYELIISILAGIFGGLICGLMYWQVDGVSVGILAGLGVGLLGGFASVTIHFSRFRGSWFWNKVYELPTFFLVLILITFFFIIFSIPVGLVFGLGDGLLVGLINSVFFGIFLGMRGRNRSVEKDIQPIERLIWSWKKAQRNGFMGLVIGLLAGISLDFIVTQVEDLNFGFIDVLIFTITGGLIGVLFGGTIGTVVDMRTVPNQGIFSSLQNALVMSVAGIIVAVTFSLMQTLGLLAGLNILLIDDLRDGLILLATLPAALGLIALLWFGGQDVIQHFVLRLLLYRFGKMPLNYAHFLDYAANELNFLQKVGGGYMFVHRYLLEHFASMAEEVVDVDELSVELGVLEAEAAA